MIYENSEILKVALTKTLSSIKQTTNNIILINISYYDGKSNDSLYSGLKYIIHLRSEQKEITPVIFYGFESLERIMKKSNASILNSPAIEYIQMPFKIDELSEKLLKVAADDINSDGLDKQTKQKNAIEKLRIFKHDIINAVNTVKIVYKLRRNGSIDTRKENWASVKKSIFMDKDLIRKNIVYFEAIEGHIIELLTEKAITGIKGNLSCSDDKYKTLLKHLARYSERNNEVVVYDADDIISLLNESVKILETVKV